MHDGLDDGVIERAGGEVVKKEQWCRALHGDVVHAMVNEVLADRVVDVELEGYFEFGAYAVCGGDEHRGRELLEIEGKEAAEAANLTQDVLIEGLARKHLDALLGAIPRGDINSGISVGQRFPCAV